MYNKVKVCFVSTIVLIASLKAQSQNPPSVSQVLMYSGTAQSGAVIPRGSVASIFTENLKPALLSDFAQGNLGPNNFGVVGISQNFTVSRSLADVNNALNTSIATALSIIPLSSPASGVIDKKDPATGAELSVNSTLGPIFTERAETIGKRRWYLGFSHQDFHFTRLNGQSLNSLSVLYPGGDASMVINDKLPNGQVVLSNLPAGPVRTVPATFNLGMDVRLSQDIAFLTYGVTDRFDVSIGLPLIHSAVAARTYNGTIYAGTGFGNPTCWCVNTFTPGTPTLLLPDIGQSSRSETGFGDVLVRLKGTVLRKGGAVMAVGTDLRFPTGDAQNYLGVGATSIKPFVALSLYSRPFRHNIVVSPHVDAGWQFTGKSVLGGTLQPSSTSGTLGAPFISTKDFLPDVLSWAVGAEVALGRHNTLIADILGNQIGLVHGIFDTKSQSISNLSFPTGPNGTAPASLGGPQVQPTPNLVTATGLVSAGRIAYGQYSGSFGYKARIVGNLVANFNLLVRFDDNGLTARAVPLYGLGYSF